MDGDEFHRHKFKHRQSSIENPAPATNEQKEEEISNRQSAEDADIEMADQEIVDYSKPVGAESKAEPQTEQKSEEEELYCICRRPFDEKRFMIGCDGCEEWFHGDWCVDLPFEISISIHIVLL